MNGRTELDAVIAPEMRGKRLDQALAELFPEYSRSRLQQWLRNGEILIDGRPRKAKEKVEGGEQVQVRAEHRVEEESRPQAIALDIVYEDEDLLVINKPAGLVVHPAAGNPDGTLLNALLHHDPRLAQLPRAGIVHRLDKQTSGLMVVARSLTSHTSLVEQLQARSIHREYEAVACGVMTAGGTVDAPIGRHPVDRKRMAVVANGKPALTHYRVEERFPAHTRIRVLLETGRTHQIRVHMAHIHFPLVGDPVYGGRLRLPRGAGEALRAELQQFRRQALHARRLELSHPGSGEPVEWQAPVPEDLRHLVDVLRADSVAQDAGE